MQFRPPHQLIHLQQVVERPVIQQKGHVAHGKGGQRDHQRGGLQLLRNAARRHQQQHQPVHGQHGTVAEQQLAQHPHQRQTDALKPGLDQRVISQQEHKDQRHLLIRHKEQAEQAHRAVGCQGHGPAALHADRGDEQAGHRRGNEHQHRHHGPQQHQGHAQGSRHAAVGHGPALAGLHGSSQRTGWFSGSSGSTAWRRPRIIILSIRLLFSLTSSIP